MNTGTKQAATATSERIVTIDYDKPHFYSGHYVTVKPLKRLSGKRDINLGKIGTVKIPIPERTQQLDGYRYIVELMLAGYDIADAELLWQLTKSDECKAMIPTALKGKNLAFFGTTFEHRGIYVETRPTVLCLTASQQWHSHALTVGFSWLEAVIINT